MKILDANIFIYAPQPMYAHLRPLLIDPDSVVSDITRVEVLGFHASIKKAKPITRRYFGALPDFQLPQMYLTKPFCCDKQRKCRWAIRLLRRLLC
ncbi:MAG: hypothetical protein KF734_05215 [Saprospiraceae bacterium]|nr:hypothetical protein [Saprospiraceae bacterium]